MDQWIYPRFLRPSPGECSSCCYQRRQKSKCAQPSLPLSEVEAQVTAYLATFHLPEETVDRIITLHTELDDRGTDRESHRRQLTSRLERIKDLYKWGDLVQRAYAVERDRLEAELASLRELEVMAGLLKQAASLLRDLPAAWIEATPEQRNELARLVFQSIEVRDDRVVAVVPQPDFTPFFAAKAEHDGMAGGNENGASGTGAVNRETEEAEATGIARAVPTDS